MYNHLALLLALATDVILGGTATYGQCRKDWCGQLLPWVGAERLPALAAISLVYLHLVHGLPWPLIAQRYELLVYGVAAFAAEQYVRRSSAKREFPFTVRCQITKVRQQLLDELSQLPNRREILVDAIYELEEEELSERQRRVVIGKLGHPPSREQMLAVIKLVGIARIRVIMSAKAQKGVAACQNSQ